MAKATGKIPTPRSPPLKDRGGRRQKLKVFRTSIGFDDAYVAAPSRKAALAAWGSGTDLFSAGSAEVVIDPKLTAEALARPGEVIRKARGSEAEHVKALGKVTKKKEPTPGPSLAREGRKTKGRRPNRAEVEKAETAVERAKARHRETAAKLRAAEQALEAARARYRKAMAAWAE